MRVRNTKILVKSSKKYLRVILPILGIEKENWRKENWFYCVFGDKSTTKSVGFSRLYVAASCPFNKSSELIQLHTFLPSHQSTVWRWSRLLPTSSSALRLLEISAANVKSFLFDQCWGRKRKRKTRPFSLAKNCN